MGISSRLIKYLLNTVERLTVVGTRMPIAVATSNALAYYPALRWNYIATIFSAVGLAAGSLASTAKNLHELSKSLQLEQGLCEQHAMLREYLQENPAVGNTSLPPLPLGLIGSDFHRRFTAAAAIPPQAVVPIAGAVQHYQRLPGITHHEKLTASMYGFSGLVGTIAAIILTYFLATCKESDSSAATCYDEVNTILIVIVMVALLVLITTHSIIASGLRHWREALDDNMQALNKYIAEKIKTTIPGKIKDSAKSFHEKTKDHLTALNHPVTAPNLPNNIFSAFDVLSDLLTIRVSQFTQSIEGLKTQIIDKDKQLGIAQERYQKLQLSQATQFFTNLQQTSSEVIKLSNIIRIMEQVIRNDSVLLQTITQAAAKQQLTELLSKQRQECEHLTKQQAQLKQRLTTLTTHSVSAKIAQSNIALSVELTKIKAMLQIEESEV